MTGETILLGVDILAILLSIIKLVGDEVKLREKDRRWYRAIAWAVAVGVAGAQGQANFIPPSAHPWVLLGFSIVTAFLTAMGYGPGIVGAGNALVDLAKFQVLKYAQAMYDTDELAARYHIIKKD